MDGKHVGAGRRHRWASVASALLVGTVPGAAAAQESPPPVVIPVHPESPVSDGIHGTVRGAWTILLTDGVVGAATEALDGPGTLGYVCVGRMRCRYFVRIRARCDDGRPGRGSYAVDDGRPRDLPFACEPGGETRLLQDAGLGAALMQATEVLVRLPGGRPGGTRFEVHGLADAIDALAEGGHIVAAQR